MLQRSRGQWPAHAEGIVALAWNPAGDLLASGGNDGVLKLWTLSDARPVRFSAQGATSLRALSWSPCGGRILAGWEDGRARLFDASTGELLKEHDDHGTWIADVAFQPGGETYATASGDRTLLLYDAARGVVSRKLFSPYGNYMKVCWSRDGLLLAAATRGDRVRIYDARDWSILDVVDFGQTVWSAEWHPSLDRLVLSGGAGRVGAWDRPTATLRLLNAHEAVVSRAVHVAQGRLILTQSHDCTSKLFDAETFTLVGERRNVYPGPSNALSPSCDRIAMPDEGGTCIAVYGLGTAWDRATSAPVVTGVTAWGSRRDIDMSTVAVAKRDSGIPPHLVDLLDASSALGSETEAADQEPVLLAHALSNAPPSAASRILDFVWTSYDAALPVLVDGQTSLIDRRKAPRLPLVLSLARAAGRVLKSELTILQVVQSIGKMCLIDQVGGVALYEGAALLRIDAANYFMLMWAGGQRLVLSAVLLSSQLDSNATDQAHSFAQVAAYLLNADEIHLPVHLVGDADLRPIETVEHRLAASDGPELPEPAQDLRACLMLERATERLEAALRRARLRPDAFDGILIFHCCQMEQARRVLDRLLADGVNIKPCVVDGAKADDAWARSVFSRKRVGGVLLSEDLLAEAGFIPLLDRLRRDVADGKGRPRWIPIFPGGEPDIARRTPAFLRSFDAFVWPEPEREAGLVHAFLGDRSYS